jgi:hypothetical protein
MIRDAAIVISAFALFYAIGAFVSLEPDVSEWQEKSRFMLVILGGMLSVMAVACDRAYNRLN